MTSVIRRLGSWQDWLRKAEQIRSNWQDYPLRDGTVWAGRYKVLRCQGMGSYGQAYACLDRETGQTVLLKRNKPSKGNLGRQLLRREDAILRSLNGPMIPKRLNYVQRHRDEALVMELVPGDNLEHRIMEQGRVYTEEEALRLLGQLMEVLAYVHQAGYVHRDVRIPNVLEHDGKITLIDYGLSCRKGEVLPEQIQRGLGDLDEPGSDEGEEPAEAAGWSAVKRRMRVPQPTSDLLGAGHLFLFMMYSGYEPPVEGEEGAGSSTPSERTSELEPAVELSWEEELQVSEGVSHLLRQLLAAGPHSDPSLTAESCRREIDALLSRS
ncbi:serine/threonine-protein kinase [Paenibacillus sp. GCM10023252]|uniref:serine/threonine-protein kinase n=1 Tax=Paenibacillus sp. GCM10023252 TaxID=3252649 RepID=UPI003610D825